jgi:hypothetical protein
MLISLSTSAQIGDDFKLPETWTKDFTISLSYHGSMSGGKTDVNVYIRFLYIRKPNPVQKNTGYTDEV